MVDTSLFTIRWYNMCFDNWFSHLKLYKKYQKQLLRPWLIGNQNSRKVRSLISPKKICFNRGIPQPLSDIYEFVHNMRRLSVSCNSPHIATNVHELCHQSFGQNCPTSSTSFTRHVHNIHGEISVGFCDSLRVY